jgi:hypothetical protein
MKRYLLTGMLACLLVISSSHSFGGAEGDAADIDCQSATDPLNAAYSLEGKTVCLTNGRSEVEAAPGSATKIVTSVFGEPIYGNIDGAGGVDAALILTHDPGGSGTFYYAAAALEENGRYQGTNAVLLGDRVAPQTVAIRNGVVEVNYADRRPQDAMAVSPSVGKTMYLILKSGELSPIKPLGTGEQVLEGWVTIGHEVRAFSPCTPKQELWLAGNSPALQAIKTAYGQALPNPKPYTPLFMTLAGKVTGPPADGFGADYKGAFWAAQLVQAFPQGNCKSELIYVDSPLPGARVTSPLKIRGWARGTWFFEGDFPIVLRDTNGKVIGKKYCTAIGNWMTAEFVRFEGTIAFKTPRSGSKGTLILKKDNPTDKPEHDDALEIPVFFK